MGTLPMTSEIRGDVLLNKLADMSNITVSERVNGQVAVYVNGNALVDEGKGI